MSRLEQWSHFFKPEVSKQGEKSFAEGDVFLKIKGDTHIHAYVKSSSPIRIHFSSISIASPLFNAACSCSASEKGQFCKHIWATLLAVEQQHPDFLDAKKEIYKTFEEPEVDEKHAAFKEKQKARQAEYRKEQYQKQKQRLKDRKSASVAAEEPGFPPKVQGAVDFFAENGFHFVDPIDPQDVANAKKVLSKVFHPDKGGTHEEILLLNSNYEILMKWSGG